jgi:hypothetical protein
VRWSYIAGSGNVVDTHGSWTVTELGGASGADASGSGASGSGRAGSRRSLVTCRMFLDPGRVSGWAMNRATRKDLPWIFQGLRQQVLRGRYSLH